MIRIAIILLILASIINFVDCGEGSVTDHVKNIGEATVEAIENFEDIRQELNESFLGMVNEMKERLGALGNSDQDAIYELAEEWETFWIEAEEDYDELLERYAEVCQSTDEYFTTLNQLTEAMDEQMQYREREKNKRVENKWSQEQEEAKASLQALQHLFQKAKQYHNVLLAEALRQQIEANTTELNRIEQEAKQLLRRLERFSLSGHRLFGVD